MATTYKIKSGDTLTAIAKQYNTTVDALVSANNIKDKNLIYAGDTLTIPDSVGGQVTVTGNADISISGSSKDKVTSSAAEKDYMQWQKQEKPVYTDKYSKEIESTLKELKNRDFSYDPSSDKAYQLYREAMKDSAQLALADATGLAAALNGGFGTTYAQQAGQMAYMKQMQEADEMIPELYKAAYSRFSDETDNIEDRLDALMDLSEDEWDRYIDLLDDHNDQEKLLFDRYTDLSNEEFDRFYSMYKLTLN